MGNVRSIDGRLFATTLYNGIVAQPKEETATATAEPAAPAD
jgi:hypothetical protein